ncbi:MAG: hypothetical protein H7A37_06590 [Chlamydiales bacterium]|nr:hypothetical protein [Chlamydiia bacterium]MCP5507950.1 hypothetical protein [Chlamydiales bacterium]
MRKFGLVILLIACAVAILVGLVYMPGAKQIFRPAGTLEQLADEDYTTAKKLLDEGNPAKSLNIIRKHRQEIESNSQDGKRWMDLFIEASVETLDTPQLVILYEYRPEAFENHEKAVLMVGDAFILTGKGLEFEELRNQWRGKETMDYSWLVLDADKLVLDGNRLEAINLLKSKEFQGHKDTGRLVRLALMYLSEDPKKSWDYFTEAMNKDPNNINLRLYRARLLEGIGKDDLALSEYLSAVRDNPDNEQLRNELADFFIRNGKYRQALGVLVETIKKGTTLDDIWLKAWFWNKVAIPAELDWKEQDIPPGQLHPLIEYLINLKPWQYWSDKEFDAVPNGKQYLNRQQATYWLRLISALKEGDRQTARNLLAYNPFAEQTWNPELELLLKLLLTYQEFGTFNVDGHGLAITPKERTAFERPLNDTAHPFLAQIRQLVKDEKSQGTAFSVPEEMDKFLKSDLAIPSAFLATGWLETAISLMKTKAIPADFPNWVAYGFTQAIRFNRSPLDALDFAKSQKSTPELSLLIGELYIAENSPDAAIEQLQQLDHLNNEIGQRAAWLVSLIYLERKEYDKAKEEINNNWMLRDSVQGKETLARIALLEGNSTLANQLYESIVDQSSEAKSYLARKAYAEKNWARARQLTIELLKEYPNNTLLRENLIRIDQEQKGGVPENREKMGDFQR